MPRILSLLFYIFISCIFMSFAVMSFAAMAQDIEDPKAKDDMLSLKLDDKYIGDLKAPVIMYEYSSVSCPHCAKFHKDIFPALKSQYIDTGVVLYVYRDLPINQPGLLGAILMNCVAKEKYFQYLKTLMDSQGMWAFSNNYRKSLENIARLGGMNDDEIKACFANSKLEERVLTKAMDASGKLKIDRTPTFFINGKKHTGDIAFEDLQTYIKEAAESYEREAKQKKYGN